LERFEEAFKKVVMIMSQYAYFNNPNLDFKRIDDVSERDAKKQVSKLRKAIDFHDYRYYIKNDPVISDCVYDQLFKRLQRLEKTFPALDIPYSPTKRVGGPALDSLKKIKHKAPLLSLHSVGQKKEVNQFLNRIKKYDAREYIVEPKFDGFSVEIIYENGKFVTGTTRGNGNVGEDISINLKTVRSLPLSLRPQRKIPPSLSVRGEVFISKKSFQNINKHRIETNKQPFANARNAAAGIMHQLDSKIVAQVPFDIYFYDVISNSNEFEGTHYKQLKAMDSLGLKTYPKNKKVKSINAIYKFHKQMLIGREGLDFDIDGIVVKVNALDIQKKLGTRERNPRWALAWKFPPKKEITILKAIGIQVGTNGKLTPVALLDPVDVGGVTISRATLHNEDQVKKIDVREGDKVRISRAGDVIPQVVERLPMKGQKRASPFSMPKKCPVCKSTIVKRGAYHICPAGLSCKAQLKGHLENWSSQQGMNIDLLGKKTISKLIEQAMVKDVADIYTLNKRNIMKLEGLADRSAKQLIESIHKNKKPSLNRFLYALGIQHDGFHIAGVLARKFSRLEVLKKATKNELENTNQIGPEIAESVCQFFCEKRNNRILNKLKKAGVWPEPKKSEKSSIATKKFVFTGKLKSFNRGEVKQLLEDLGGRVNSRVSKLTDYLVVGKNPGSKYDAAKHNNIKIISESEFKDML
jgi:DNA ligase (NAD+)